jgi:transposase
LIIAPTTLADLGDLSRFSKAKQLMANLGQVPSEQSRGDSQHRGSITKTVNSRVRQALTEWAKVEKFQSSIHRVGRPKLKYHTAGQGHCQPMLFISCCFHY